MKIYKEISLKDFEAWCGAKDTLNALTDEEIQQIEDYFENEDDPMWETQLNDFLWFEKDTIAGILGYESWEELETDDKRLPY